MALFHRIDCGTSPSLFRFISFHSALLIRCRSTITVYVISRNIISPQKPATIIITFPCNFHVISGVSGRNRCLLLFQ